MTLSSKIQHFYGYCFSGLGCNCSRSKAVGIFEVVQKYCCSATALVPEKEVFAGVSCGRAAYGLSIALQVFLFTHSMLKYLRRT